MAQAKKKKKKKEPAMKKKVKSPSKKQRRSSGHSISGPEFLSPGSNGTIINSGGGNK